VSDTPPRGRPVLGDEELLALARRLPEPSLTDERKEEMRTAFLSSVRGLRSEARVRAPGVGERRRLLLLGTAVAASAAAALAGWHIGKSRRQPAAAIPATVVAVEHTPKGSFVPAPLPSPVRGTAPPTAPDRPASASRPRRVALAPHKSVGDLGDSDSVEVAFARGWSSLRSGDFNTAAQWFARVTAGQNNTLAEDALFWQGVALDRAGRFAIARQVVTDFLARHPDSDRRGEASVILGWLFVRSGEFSAAHELFEGALDDPAERVRNSAHAGLLAAEKQSRDAASAVPIGP